MGVILFIDAFGILLGSIFIFIIIGLPVIGIVFLLLRDKKRKQNQANEAITRHQYLLDKFGDYDTVQRILDRNIGLGDSESFVLEAFGSPNSIDSEVLKTKTKYTWKYKKGNEIRRDQHNFQIKLENGIVVGWEDKN